MLNLHTHQYWDSMWFLWAAVIVILHSCITVLIWTSADKDLVCLKKANNPFLKDTATSVNFPHWHRFELIFYLLFNATITFRREISQSLAMPKRSSMTNCFLLSWGEENTAPVCWGTVPECSLNLTLDHLKVQLMVLSFLLSFYKQPQLASQVEVCRNGGLCQWLYT